MSRYLHEIPTQKYSQKMIYSASSNQGDYSMGESSFCFKIIDKEVVNIPSSHGIMITVSKVSLNSFRMHLHSMCAGSNESTK